MDLTTPAEQENLVKPGPAARRLGVSTKTLARRAEHGALTAIRIEGGHRRYLEDEIRAIESQAS